MKTAAELARGTSNVVFRAPVIGPYAIGWSIDVTGSFASVWWMMAAGPAVGILLLLPVNPGNRRG